MLHTSRFVLIGLLALMQLIAPLVHAHAGGGGVAGFPHLPELEILAHQPPDSVEAAAGQDRLDVIVSMGPGLHSHADRLTPAPDTVAPADSPGDIRPVLARARAAFSPYLPAPERSARYPAASPRGPPGANLTH